MNNYRVAKLINNEFVIDDIRIFYPNVSFPTEGLTKEIIDSFETYEVVERLPCLNIEKIIVIIMIFISYKFFKIVEKLDSNYK